MHRLNTDFDRKELVKLKIGQKILLSGTIFGARDKAHQFLLDSRLDEIKGSIIYHCGPIIDEKNEVIAAGPTTSARMNRYTPRLIEKYDLRAIIGKGGMDRDVIESLRGRAVYFSAIGGAAVSYAKSMTVKKVYKKEFGMPEAIWEFSIRDFPVVVAIDSKGNSLYQQVMENSKIKLEALLN